MSYVIPSKGLARARNDPKIKILIKIYLITQLII